MTDEHLKAVISADSSQLNGELDKAKAKVKEVESASTTATSKSAEGWKALSQGILKAGSSMAIIAKGVESLINIFRQLREAATEAFLAITKTNTGNQAETSRRNYDRATAAQQAVKNIADLQRQASENPSETNEAAVRQARAEFRRMYGDFEVDFDSTESMQEAIAEAQRRRLKAINEEIHGYEKANDAINEQIGKLNDLMDSKQIKELQAQKDANATALRKLAVQARELEQETPDSDFARMERAKDYDAEQKRAEAEQREREATAEKLAKEREQKGRELLAAQKAYLDAQKREAQAIRELADTERQLARERRASAIDARRERLQSRMSRYGFTPYEGFDMDESNPDRLRRRRQQRLDATIADKMARQESGQRVYYTNRERERIGEYERLQKQDSALQAAQKQMDAADRQRQASETMLRAVNALSASRNATRLAADGYGQAVTALNDTLQQMLRTTYLVR